jgi:hypothetical protein
LPEKVSSRSTATPSMCGEDAPSMSREVPPTGIHNTGSVPLVFVEAQQGDYFEEDDIVRLDDDYDGRLPLGRSLDDQPIELRAS